MNKNKKYFLIYVVNILLGLLYISPLIWMVVSAFKPENIIVSEMQVRQDYVDYIGSYWVIYQGSGTNVVNLMST